MDSIPLILQLIKSNILLYSVAVSGSIDTIPAIYEKECHILSEHGIKIDSFMLTPSDTFDFVLFLKPPGDSFVTITLFTQSTKFKENLVTYFGDKTVYHKVLPLFKEKGFTPKNPYCYCYPDFDPPAYVCFRHLSTGSYSISMQFGKDVCEGKEFSLPEKPEE